MNPWVREVQHLIPVVLGTDLTWLMAVMILAGTFLFAMVFVKLGDYMNFPRCSSAKAMLVLVFTLTVILATTVSARFYLEPRFGAWTLLLGSGAGFFIGGTFPVVFTRTRYMRGLLALLLSFAAAAAIMAMTRAAGMAVLAGDSSVDRLRDRQEETGRSLRL